MVKSNIFKGLGKPFVILIILFILSMLLFSSGNSCLVENFTPNLASPNVSIDTTLWVDKSNPTFKFDPIISKFSNIADEYYKKGKTNFTFSMRYKSDIKTFMSSDTSELVKSLPPDWDKNPKLKYPFVTVQIVERTNGTIVRKFINGIEGDITQEKITQGITSAEVDNYSKMYNLDSVSNSNNSNKAVAVNLSKL